MASMAEKGDHVAVPDHVEVLVVVEDEPDMRELIRIMLSADPRLQVAGEAASAQEAIVLARSQKPGVIVLDHWIEGKVMGLQAAPALKQAAPQAKILLFSAYDLGDKADAEPAIDAFLRKDSIEQLLPTVLRLSGLEP